MKEVRARAVACAAAALLALGAAACGSDDDGGDAAADSSSTTSSPDERAVRATLEAMSNAMAARDYKAVCDVVTPAVRKSSLTWEDYPTCEKAMADALTDDPTGKADVVNAGMPRITAVEINGRKAVVSAQRGQKKLVARVEKHGDSWLLERWFSDD